MGSCFGVAPQEANLVAEASNALWRSVSEVDGSNPSEVNQWGLAPTRVSVAPSIFGS